MKTALLLCAAAVLAAPSAPAASKFTDGRYGFSVVPPSFDGIPAGQSVVSAMFFAPAKGGFASNVNVMVQNVVLTADQYAELSRKQFAAAKFTVTSEERAKVSGRDALRYVYEGKQQGHDLKFMALAVVGKERVYLLTCTAPKRDFAGLEKRFKECLDSFALEE